MGLKTKEAADKKLNGFWRAIVLAEEAPMTPPSPAPEESRRRAHDTIGLAIDSHLDLIEMVEPVTKGLTAKMGFDEDDTGRIELAVREAVTNAIKHGNRSLADPWVDVQFLIELDALTIYVRLRGERCDPSRLPVPIEPENLLNPMGRGILMRTFMDEVEYAAHPEGGSVVRLKKYKRPFKLTGARAGHQSPGTEVINGRAGQFRLLPLVGGLLALLLWLSGSAPAQSLSPDGTTVSGILTDRLSPKGLQQWRPIERLVLAEDQAGQPRYPTLRGL